MNHPIQIALFSLAFLAACICIAALARRYHRPAPAPDDAQIAAEQLAEAKRQVLLHTALAEQHDAQATMYAGRVLRLQGGAS